MDENNKYCACTGTDAMFHIKLNQQGPEGKQGPQGIKGVDGISPSISVESSTQNNYQLRVSTAYNTFVTPNLKGDDKVQIDPYTLTKPGDIPEFGLNKTVTNSDIIDGVVTIPGGLGFSININDNVQGTHSIEPQYRFPITTTITENGVVIGKSTSYLLTNYSISANNPIMLTRNKNGSVTFDFDNTVLEGKQDKFATVTDSESTTSLDTNGKALSITAPTIAVGNNLVNEINGSNSQLYLKQNDVVAGDNITVSKTATGIVITGTASQYTLPIASATTLGGIKVGENLTIDENGTLNATGGSGTTIDDSTTSTTSTWSSSKINSEITTVANEVVQVQGEVASLDADISTIKPIVESNATDIEDLKETKNDNIFDINKFTIVGSPTITDDGVASGFSNVNYIESSITTVSSTSTFEIKIKFKLSEVASAWTKIWGINSGGYSQVFITSRAIVFNWNVNGTNYSSKISFSFTGTEDITYTFGWNGTQIYSRANINGLDYTGESVSLATSIEFSKIYFANVGSTEAIFNGSIDLKHFSITVDGKEVFNGLMESTKPIYDKITTTNSTLSTFKADTTNNFSAVNSALNEKANLSDLANYVPLTTYNAKIEELTNLISSLTDRVTALETEINGGNA